jgi:plastocyanin domain-containing protein
MNATYGLIAIALVGIVGIFFLSQASASEGGLFSGGSGGSIPIGQKFIAPIKDGIQEFTLRATDAGTYAPNYITLKQGIPVRIHYQADVGAGCGREVIIPFAHVRKIAPLEGESLIEFTPTEKGVFPFHCSMQMFRGKMEVV